MKARGEGKLKVMLYDSLKHHACAIMLFTIEIDVIAYSFFLCLVNSPDD